MIYESKDLKIDKQFNRHKFKGESFNNNDGVYYFEKLWSELLGVFTLSWMETIRLHFQKEYECTYRIHLEC